MDCIELKPEQIIRKGKYPAPNIDNHDSLFFHPLTQHGSSKELEKWGYDLATICRKKNITYYYFINDFGKRINVYPNDIIKQWWANYDTLKKQSIISTSENIVDNTFSLRETKQRTVERAIEIVINNHNTNSNANHNSQSTDVNQEFRQSISVTVEVQLKAIFDSFTDELTTKQIRELNQIQASDLPSEEKKKSILSILGDKVLDFGVAVLANPDIWAMFK